MQNLCLYLALLLHNIDIFLAYVAALFMASISKLSRACGGDARTGDSWFFRKKSPKTFSH